MYDSIYMQDEHGVTTDRVVINVGGTRHECYISTIQNFPDTRLYWIAETALKMADFNPDGNEFFFDRHPGCFQNILNYCRTGKLHCPNDVCGPLFEEELKFWGIDELMMEPCCWGNYTQHREAKKTLRLFDDIYQDTVHDEEMFRKHKHHHQHNIMDKLQYVCQNIWHILEKPGKNIFSKFITFTILFVTLLSITTYCLETIDTLKENNTRLFEQLEIFYCLFFTIDFLVRFCCSPSKIKFLKSYVAWMDFLSTLQFYIAIFTNLQMFSVLFMLRLLRVFRLLHFFKNFTGILVIGQTLKASARELMTLALILCVPMVIFSTMVFYAEQDTNKSHFPSIPHTFWWAVITMTTVGYGDQYPSSGYGKFLGALCAFSGILIVALPISVIGNNFNFYYSYAQARMRLPKRQYHVMIAADKGLMDMDENTDITSEDEENEFLNRSSRRSAISSSKGPIRKSITALSNHLNKNNKKGSLIKKSSLNNPENKENMTDPSKLCSESAQKCEINIQNKHLLQPETMSLRSEKSCLTINDEQELKQRSKTMPYAVDQPLSFAPRLNRLSQSQYSLDIECSKSGKRVFHLDIQSYEPTKLDASACAMRRKHSSYQNHPLRNLQRSNSPNLQHQGSPMRSRKVSESQLYTPQVERKLIEHSRVCSPLAESTDTLSSDSLLNNKQKSLENSPRKKMSVIKRIDTTDVIVWMQEE